MPRHEITSRQNERIKQAAQLRSGRQRTKQCRFVIDGVREIARALAANIEIEEAFICPALCEPKASRELAQRLDGSADFVADVTPGVFEKLAYGNKADGIIVVARTPARGLAQLQLAQGALIAILAGLEKPGNVGAILRSADGAGLDAVIVVDPGTDLFNPNTIRASVGTIFSPRVCVASVSDTLTWLHEQDVALVATRPEASQLYSEVNFRAGTAILLGSEADGLSDDWRGANTIEVRLPMLGIADSLNVSTAAAILFYEARRQRALVT
jgi:TrmH family RNA methyltransferase